MKCRYCNKERTSKGHHCSGSRAFNYGRMEERKKIIKMSNRYPTKKQLIKVIKKREEKYKDIQNPILYIGD